MLDAEADNTEVKILASRSVWPRWLCYFAAWRFVSDDSVSLVRVEHWKRCGLGCWW